MSDHGQQAMQPQAEGAGPNPDLRKVARWIAEIELYDRETSKWKKQRQRIIKRYKDDRGDRDDSAFGARFNVLWANTQTQMPSLYARNPKPDIQRRFKDNDPVGRVASDILERCANYFTETDKFYSANRRAVKDFKLVGRGTTWERYVPTMAPSEEITNTATAGEKPPAVEVIAYEEAITDYIHPDDFGHNICRTPDEIWCGWRIVYMDRARLVERFKEPGKTVPLDYVQKDIHGEKLADGVSKASIYELWDKDRKCAVWFHKSLPDALDLRPDPLKLDGFFPFPMPLFSNLANDSCIPTPDYIEYQDQAIELDDLTTRISMITKALKVAGIYDASAEGIQRVLNEGVENKLIPVENFAILAEKGGLANAISFLPIKDIASALMTLYEARDKVKEDLHEISGIPDIARGQSDANETLGAQELKTSFAINRISDDQRDVQRFVREEVRLKVDIICGHFQIDTIKKISGVRLFTVQEKSQVKQFQQVMAQQPPPQPGQPPSAPLTQPPPIIANLSQEQIEQMMNDPTWEEIDALIRNDAMRCFRIDIETDSTIKADETQEKQSRIEFVKAIGEYMASALPAGQQHPELVPFLLEGLQFLARGFPVGKNMESALNVAIAKLEKIAANPQPRPDPEMAKVQGQLQVEQVKEQNAQTRVMAEIEAKKQADIAEAANRAQVDQHLNEVEAQRRTLEIQTEDAAADREAQRQAHQQEVQWAHERELATINGNRDIKIAEIKATIAKEQAIEVANINVGAKVDIAAQDRAAEQVDEEIGAPEATPEEDEDMKNTKEVMAKLDALMDHLGKPQPDVAGAINNLAAAHQQTHDGIANLHKAVTSEREIVRDGKTGKPTGVRIKPSPKELANQLRN